MDGAVLLPALGVWLSLGVLSRDAALAVEERDGGGMPGYIPLIDSISQMCFDWNVEESENYRFPNNSANIALIAIPVERRAARLDEPAFP